MLVSCTSFVNSGMAKLLELRSREFPVLLSLLLLLCICVWLGCWAWFRALLDEDLLSLMVFMVVLWWLYAMPDPVTLSNNGDVELFILAVVWSSAVLFGKLPLLAFSALFVGSSSMYVKSESGRGPVWLRELRILCKLCKLWTERRSSKSSRVDLNALITRSCKNREEDVLSGSEEASQRHTSMSYLYLSQFVCVNTYVVH